MKRFTLVKVPTEATEVFINNIGCLRYSHNQGRESTAVEPMEMGVYLEKSKHRIVGESFINEQRYIVIEMDEW
jgi:hypothetical protein